MYPVVHFELPYIDAERISRFYSTVFGWRMQNLGNEGGTFIIITTAENDAKPGEQPGPMVR